MSYLGGAEVSGNLTLRYLCTSDYRDIVNIGTTFDLVFQANVFNPPTLNVGKTRQYSNKRRRHYTTKKWRNRTGSVGTPFILKDADLPQWHEFFESVADDEEFDLLATEFPGVDRDFTDIFIPDSSFAIPRNGTMSRYAISFNFEEAL